MGLRLAPDADTASLIQLWPCRDLVVKQLSALLNGHRSSPSAVVVYGPKTTGKTSIVRAFLEKSHLQHAYLSSRECVTGRQLLERAIANVRAALGRHEDGSAVVDAASGPCEHVSALVMKLQIMLKGCDKFMLVFDGIDRQREAHPTLLPALARLGDMVHGLTVIMIMRHATPRSLNHSGLAHVHFPPYTRAQSIQIVSAQPLDIFPQPLSNNEDYDDETHAEDKAWLWPRFCAAVWDSLAQNAARDLSSYHELCIKLWRPFVEPIVKGDFGTQDFTRLMVAQTRLFQDESILMDSIVAAPKTELCPQIQDKNHELPYHAKWLLIAAFLASFNPPRTDALHFMKTTERKRRKKGGGTVGRTWSRPGQVRKTPRHLLSPSAFTLDRLLAILHSILPDEFRSTIDIHMQVATLSNLRLLVRSVGIGSSDPLEPGAKWRVGAVVTWEFAQSIARGIDFSLLDHIAE